MSEICHELDLKQSAAAAGADLVTGFHHVVWMGDLNYRLEYGQQVRQGQGRKGGQAEVAGAEKLVAC